MGGWAVLSAHPLSSSFFFPTNKSERVILSAAGAKDLLLA